MRLALTIKSGSLSGKTFELTAGAMLIGRSENSSVKFDHLQEKVVSKQHAFIESRADGFYLIDNHSTNGTFINGREIGIEKLNDGDQVQFGRNGVVAGVVIEEEMISQPTIVSSRNVMPLTTRPTEFDSDFLQPPVSIKNTVSGIGLGPPDFPNQPPKDKTGRYVGIGLTIFGIVFLLLIVIVILFWSLTVSTAILAAVVAFTPAVFYLLPLIFLDRYDPEPVWLLGLAFAWGALVSVIVSIVINTAFGIGVAVIIHPAVGNLASAVISAPIFEEASKGIGLLILLIFYRRYFDDILDGIVFGGVIALGFATVENVLYYGRAFNEEGLTGMVLLFGLRGILSPFAHVLFTSLTGIGCGISRESHNKFIRIAMPVLGYIAAVFLHGLWNAMGVLMMVVLSLAGLIRNCEIIGLGNEPGLCAFLVGYGVLEVPLFLIFVAFVVFFMRRQNKILREMLAIDVARGFISEEHLKTATSAFRSLFWVWGGIFTGKFRARSIYLRSIGKLGLSYWHIQRATAAQGHTASFQQNPILREEVLKWRERI